MKKKIVIIIILLIFVLLNFYNVKAIIIYDENKPGLSSGSGGGSATGETKWDPPYIRAIRVRVFRNNEAIRSGYFYLAETSKTCYGNISSRPCETTGYDFKNSIEASNSSCSSSSRNIQFSACLYQSGLTTVFDSGKNNSNGVVLDNYLKNTDYLNLKEVLKAINYNESVYSENDIVIVEPATRIYYNNTSYFGTVNSLKAKNFAYKNDTNAQGKCGSSDNAYTCFAYTFDNMSYALKINDGKNCKYDTAGVADYSGCGYFKYNIKDIPGLKKSVTLTINKKDTNTKIGMSNVTFTLTGNGQRKTCTTNSEGVCSLIIPASDNSYTLTESKPRYYSTNASCEGCETTNGLTFTVKVTDNKSITIYNEKTCNSELSERINDGENERIARIYMYEHGYGYNKDLLNFQLSKEDACSNNTSCSQNINLGCLSATASNSGFSADNMACYMDTIKLGNKVGYCGYSYNLKNNLKGTYQNIDSYNFPDSLAGQMVLKRLESNRVIARSTFNRICYVYGGDTSNSITNDTFSISSYIGNLKLNNEVLSYVDENSSYEKNAKSSYVQVTKSFIRTYNLNPVYFERITGVPHKNKCKNCVLAEYGFYSALNTKNHEQNIAQFSLNFMGSEKNSNKCTYKVKNKIVDTTPEPDNPETLNLEFRVIDTKNPFPGKFGNGRRAGRNWCVASIEDKDLYKKCVKRTLQSIAGTNIDNIENLLDEINTNLSHQINLGKFFGSSSNKLETLKQNLEGLKQDIKNSFMLDLSEEEKNLLDINYNNGITIEDLNLFIQYWINWKTPEDEALNKINQLRTYYSNNIALLDDTELDCESNNSIITEYIIDSTDSYGYNKSTNTYNNKPMYHIVLDSKTINSIRKYNKENPYDNYDMKCETNGKNCTSNFLDNSEIWNSENLIQR